MRKALLFFSIIALPILLPSCGGGDDEYENSGSGTSNQCQAKTKDGTRCKRNAEKGSIYCWQHKK